MPDAVELLTHRRSVKPVELVAPAPSPAQIETMLRIASRVPDHGKLAPWRFIVFEGAGRQRAGEIIASVFASDNPNVAETRVDAEKTRLTRAPLVIAVVSRAASHPKIPEWEQVLSAGAAAMNLLTAAHALGFAANWITEWYAYDRRVLEALGLAPHERIAGFVHIGTATQAPEDRDRPPLASVVTHFESAAR